MITSELSAGLPNKKETAYGISCAQEYHISGPSY